MKRLFIFLLVILPVGLQAQYYDVIKWSTESEIQNGIKIKTLIPVDNNLHMPTITIEGYDYGTSSSIALMVSWTLKDGIFQNATASSSGGFAPEIILMQKEGFIQIFLKTWGFKTRFRITALANGVNEMPSWFQNWTIEDSAPDGENIMKARYHNEFNGDVQIGTLSAQSAAISNATIGDLKLTGVLKGQLPVVDVENDGAVNIIPGDGGIQIISGNDNYSYIDFWGISHIQNVNPQQGRILHSDNVGFKFYTGGVTGNPKMVINNNGVVGIGNTAGLASGTDPYKLYVEGGIRTRKLKVDASATNWPDYVFEPAYSLRSLASLEAFIKANKHLPDVPSADEVGKDGVDVGEVQAALLKKVEELTLYVIELNKKVTTQQATIEKQQQVLNMLKTKR